jgi:hypothetical protein
MTSEDACDSCGRPAGAGHEPLCYIEGFIIKAVRPPDDFPVKIKPETIQLSETDPKDIIKEELNLLVQASIYGPADARKGFPSGWSAIGAEYRIRMALNKLTNKENK